MLSFIKTALVTIIISFISGVLLDYYRNYAPRIVCSIGRNRVIRKNGKKVKVYSLTIRNISKKTIHNLNVNITAKCDNLQLHNTKITNGLTFDIADENNMFNITIPFLSPSDGLMTKVILEGDEENKNRPVVNLKSPESFKQVDSYKNKQKENDYSIIDNINNFFEKVFYNNRKIILGVVALAVLVFMGILAGEYYSKTINSGNKVYQKAGSESLGPSSESDTDTTSVNGSSNLEAPSLNSENYDSGEGKQSGESGTINDYPDPSYNEYNGYNNGTNTAGEGSTSSYGAEGEDTTGEISGNNEENADNPSEGENTEKDDGTTTSTDTTSGSTSDTTTTEGQGNDSGDTTSSGGTDTTGTVGSTNTTEGTIQN